MTYRSSLRDGCIDDSTTGKFRLNFGRVTLVCSGMPTIHSGPAGQPVDPVVVDAARRAFLQTAADVMDMLVTKGLTEARLTREEAQQARQIARNLRTDL